MSNFPAPSTLSPAPKGAETEDGAANCALAAAVGAAAVAAAGLQEHSPTGLLLAFELALLAKFAPSSP